MQTFLPFADFQLSCKVLDKRRLANQRREALTILNAINNPTNGWYRHPAVQQWIGYDEALKLYLYRTIEESIVRGINNKMPLPEFENEYITLPPWVGYEPYHSSHRSNLLRKDPDWYGQFDWKELPDLPYVWVSKLERFKQ